MLWHRFAENTYASFVYANPPKKVRRRCGAMVGRPCWT
jgi:hypothetical protein